MGLLRVGTSHTFGHGYVASSPGDIPPLKIALCGIDTLPSRPPILSLRITTVTLGLHNGRVHLAMLAGSSFLFRPNVNEVANNREPSTILASTVARPNRILISNGVAGAWLSAPSRSLLRLSLVDGKSTSPSHILSRLASCPHCLPGFTCYPKSACTKYRKALRKPRINLGRNVKTN